MVAQPHQPLMSVEEYLELDRNSFDVRYEFIDGHVYMLAGGTADHSTISVNMTSLLHSLLRDTSCRVYNSDMKVRLSEKRYVYPDVSISCDPRDRGRIDFLECPRLVVEVLSPSTEAFDRGKKFGYYRTCPTIEEYVLVDTQRQTVEVYRRATHNLWVLRSFGPDDQVELASLNVSFSVAAVYENVVFPEDTSDS
ncbi:MAG: Uma2 family endonuclease [Chloroflexi bacterium]|nr:Uma2 family endonuclease [Ktedonobacteraceae bacterium]MBV9021979.1 Uma2 family endonuclease [Ktedonobacteraceae bacterium]MBV9707673.1 Uma2 family endonuclease [Chloroflexota bacterium]